MSAINVVAQARRSQRTPFVGGDLARGMMDAAIARDLAAWITFEIGLHVSPSLLDDLHSGVVLCTLGSKMGNIPIKCKVPTNEFQRMENFSAFARACRAMGVSSQPPPPDGPLSAYIPPLVELAGMRCRRVDNGTRCPLCGLGVGTTVALMDHLERTHANLTGYT